MSKSKLIIVTASAILVLLLAVGGYWLSYQSTEEEASNSPSHHFSQVDTNTIVFSTSMPEGLLKYRMVELIYTEAFSRMGYDFKLFSYPPERSLVDADAGRVDGDAARVYNLQDNNQYPNLIRVEELIFRGAISAYSIHVTVTVDDWSSLKNTNYVVVVEQGNKIAQAELPEYIDSDHIITVENPEQAISVLKAGRADILVAATSPFDMILNEPEHEDAEIQKLGNVWAGGFYPYLHRKHSELAPRLAATLREMKNDGTYQRLVNEAGDEQVEK